MAVKNEEIFYNIQDNICVIDPNKLLITDHINGTKVVADRNVKQEDLVMYVGLKAYSVGKSDIFVGTDGKTSVTNFGEIAVNFLNPLQTKDTFKNFFTTQWTDAFTSSDIENKHIDPETFGIKSVEITQNASLVPRIVIDFVDVRGKTLLERGDDKDNPYNLFYSIPYPSFMLTVKGYYGKAVTYPLVLLKTNTSYDASSGNYNIKCEFLSRTFAIFNDFLLAYALAAPYMFKISPKEGGSADGDFIGMSILKNLYESQNKKIEADANAKYLTEKVGSETLEAYKTRIRLDRRKINKPITIRDLLNATKTIQNGDFDSDGNTLNQAAFDARSIMDDFKTDFNIAVSFLKDYITVSNPTNLATVVNGSFVLPNNLNFNSEFNDYIANVNYAYDRTLKTSTNTEIIKLVKLINTELQLGGLKSSTSSLLDSKLLSKLNVGTNKIEISLDKFNAILNIFESKITQAYEHSGNLVMEAQRDSIQKRIGFDITVENVIRIFMNSMQVFLMMLNLSTKKAFIDIKNKNVSRLTSQEKYGEYNQNGDNDIKKMYPWPNYYTPDKTLVSIGDQTPNQRIYPGSKLANSEWPEVKFIEEIYKSFEYLKHFNEPEVEGIILKNTALITPFLNVVSIDQYNNMDETSLSLEIIKKSILSMIHDGINTSGPITEIEISDLSKNIINEVDYDFLSLKEKLNSGTNKDKSFFPLQKLVESIFDKTTTKHYDFIVGKITGKIKNLNTLNNDLLAESKFFELEDYSGYVKKTKEITHKKYLSEGDIYSNLFNKLSKDDNPLLYANPGITAAVERTAIFNNPVNNTYRALANSNTNALSGTIRSYDDVINSKVFFNYGFENASKYPYLSYVANKGLAATNLNSKINGITALTINNSLSDEVAVTTLANKFNKY